MESPQCQPGGQASPHPKLSQVLQSQQARHLCTSREPGCGLAERNPRSHCGPLACPLRPLHWLSFLFSTAQPEMSGEVVTRNCGLLTQEPRTATETNTGLTLGAHRTVGTPRQTAVLTCSCVRSVAVSLGLQQAGHHSLWNWPGWHSHQLGAGDVCTLCAFQWKLKN